MPTRRGSFNTISHLGKKPHLIFNIMSIQIFNWFLLLTTLNTKSMRKMHVYEQTNNNIKCLLASLLLSSKELIVKGLLPNEYWRWEEQTFQGGDAEQTTTSPEFNLLEYRVGNHFLLKGNFFSLTWILFHKPLKDLHLEYKKMALLRKPNNSTLTK